MSWFSRKDDTSLQDAEEYIRSGTGALWRHYNTQGVQDLLKSKAGVNVSDEQVEDIVEKVRREKRGY